MKSAKPFLNTRSLSLPSAVYFLLVSVHPPVVLFSHDTQYSSRCPGKPRAHTSTARAVISPSPPVASLTLLEPGNSMYVRAASRDLLREQKWTKSPTWDSKEHSARSRYKPAARLTRKTIWVGLTHSSLYRQAFPHRVPVLWHWNQKLSETLNIFTVCRSLLSIDWNKGSPNPTKSVQCRMSGIIWGQPSVCLFQSSEYKGYRGTEVSRIFSLEHIDSTDCLLQARWDQRPILLAWLPPDSVF